MGLLSLSLRRFRCFEAVDCHFTPYFNLVLGNNASGKTSILEAIFLLSRGRSFRTGHLDTAVQDGASSFSLIGKIGIPSSVSVTTISLNRKDGLSEARISGEPTKALAQLSTALPLQLVNSQANLLVYGGPRQRRQFLDWGVFHVEPVFFPAWRRYRRVLKQRNSLLRGRKPNQEIRSWDMELATTAVAIDELRRQYLADLQPKATGWAEQALGGLKVSFEYRPGWPGRENLLAALASSLDRDREAGVTQFGPHRAEMLITVEGKPAQNHLSRGQEKALAGALLLAQAAVYKDLTGHPCLMLLDDLAAELDSSHLTRFMEQLEESGAQALITAVDPPQVLRKKAGSLFHVKQGEIYQMV